MSALLNSFFTECVLKDDIVYLDYYCRVLNQIKEAFEDKEGLKLISEAIDIFSCNESISLDSNISDFKSNYNLQCFDLYSRTSIYAVKSVSDTLLTIYTETSDSYKMTYRKSSIDNMSDYIQKVKIFQGIDLTDNIVQSFK